MFDFLDSDWFIIGLEIVFIVLISYDVYKYVKTKKKQYILNVVLTFGFAVWTLYPFYTKYYEWNDKDRDIMMKGCLESGTKRYCGCLENMIFKEYDEKMYKKLEKENNTDFLEFMNESKKDCLEY
jgi:hypothetical protein